MGAEGDLIDNSKLIEDEDVTEYSVDPKYNHPYIDVDELRDNPVRHRYVHGGFSGTDARFSFYFPLPEQYQGRFYQNTYPMATSEDIGPFPIEFEVATGNLGFTISSGAYYVQTNLGGADRTPTGDLAIGAYRVNAEAAKYSRVVAASMYGAHRPFGYLFGGSGGSYQVIGSAENTSGVWDGFLPFVIGTPNSIPSMFTVRLHALRVLKQRNKLPGIMDAINPGGSGNPFLGLNEEERSALQEAASLGFPLRGWWNYDTMTSGYFSQVAPLVPMLDPTYIDDFWTKPGYLGSSSSSLIKSQRFEFDTTIVKSIDGFPRRLELAHKPEQDCRDSHLVILSGASEGASVPIARIEGKIVGFAFAADHSVIDRIKPGDDVRIDNAWALALQTYQRHQVPGPDLVGWNQYRDAEGEPLYPQRDFLIGPLAAAGTAGSMPNGEINGKMLVVQTLMDIDAMPWQADWYRTQVKQALGDDFSDNFALWYIDHAQHDNPNSLAAHAHTVNYDGVLQQALHDLSAWVESGLAPAETCYEIVDAQVQVPENATQRKGIQPTVDLKVNGGIRADIAVDEKVTFTANVEVPPGAGQIVGAEWDFEGVGSYPATEIIEIPSARLSLSAVHSFSRAGTYFAVLRVTAQREGNMHTPYTRVKNLARVRVVVT